MVLVLKKTREFWFLLTQHQQQNCCHGNSTKGVIWFLVALSFSIRPHSSPRPLLLSDLPHWPRAWNRLITKSFWSPINGNRWFLNTLGWLSIGHWLADTNRCQLTNMHRLVSIDRLLSDHRFLSIGYALHYSFVWYIPIILIFKHAKIKTQK